MRIRVLTTALLALLLAATAAQAEPVNFKELIPLLTVKLPGWTPGTPNGSTVKAPLEASEATLEYVSGDKTLEIGIYDGGPALGAAMGASAQQVEMETPDQVIKSVNLKNGRGMLYLNTKDKEADLVIVVQPRFAVTLHLNGASDGAVLLSAAEQLDLGKLSGLAK